jgi:hypothetical protein
VEQAVSLLVDDKVVPAWKAFQALIESANSEETRNAIRNHDAYKECERRVREMEALIAEITDNTGWTVLREDKNGKTLYRAEEGMDAHSFKVSGTMKAPLLNVLAVIYELDLWSNWFPFMKTCVETAQASRFNKSAHMTLGLLFPIANRDFVINGFGVDLIETRQVVVVARSLPEPDSKTSPSSSRPVSPSTGSPTASATPASGTSSSAATPIKSHSNGDAQHGRELADLMYSHLLSPVGFTRTSTSRPPSTLTSSSSPLPSGSNSNASSPMPMKRDSSASSPVIVAPSPSPSATASSFIANVPYQLPAKPPYVAPPKGVVRAMINRAGFLLTAQALDSCTITWVVNVDPKMPLPISLVNFAAGKIVHWIVYFLEKAAHFKENSEYSRRIKRNPAVYEYIRDVLASAYSEALRRGEVAAP